MKEDGSDEDNGFNGMFDDPDPFDTFVHTFVPQNTTTAGIGGVASITSGGESTCSPYLNPITITLRGHKAEIGQTLNSTGLTLWRAAPILCQFLMDNADVYVKNKNILELGAGLGLCGILAGVLQARRVYITDGDSASLKGLRENVDRNDIPEPSDRVKCRQLRWGVNLDQFSRHIASDVRGDDSRFDMIMGSDIIYVETIIDPLFTTVDALLTLGGTGTFILAYARRNVKIDTVLSAAVRYNFEWALPDGEEGCFVFTRKVATAESV